MEPIPLPDRLDDMIAAYCTTKGQDLIRKHSTTLELRSGEHIFREKQPADHLYMVRHGRVKVFSTFEPGTSRILRFARDGQALGHRGIGLDFTFTVSATALTPTTVDLIPMPLIMNVLRTNAAFSFHFMLFFAEELRRSEEQAKNMMKLSVLQRVAKALLATVRCFGFEKDDNTLLAFTPSRQDLADFAGTSYASTIRALSTLQQRKLIKNVGREIRIVDLRKLSALTQG